jgi:hypothetical protein
LDGLIDDGTVGRWEEEEVDEDKKYEMKAGKQQQQVTRLSR